MHNWKWMNLSKMAGLNILSLDRRQSSSDKKHNLSLRLVLFFPFSAVVLPALCSFLHRQWNKRNYSTTFSEMFFILFTRNTFLVECLRSRVLQAACAYKRREFWPNLTHLCGFWLDVLFFFKREKASFVILIGRTLFFTRENHCSLLWLAGTHLRMKIYDIFLVCISQYVCNKILYHFFCHTFSTIAYFEVCVQSHRGSVWGTNIAPVFCATS